MSYIKNRRLLCRHPLSVGPSAMENSRISEQLLRGSVNKSTFTCRLGNSAGGGGNFLLSGWEEGCWRLEDGGGKPRDLWGQLLRKEKLGQKSVGRIELAGEEMGQSMPSRS